MKKDKIGIAVIACGGRSKSVVHNLIKDAKGGIELLAAYDPNAEIMDSTIKFWNAEDTVKKCSSVDEAINTPGVEWVMVFSPNAFHKEHILAAFNAGKHVFSEKPLATSIDDCKDIFDAHSKTNLFFATGFVLRYAPIYRKAKELLDSGKFGKLLSIEANENIPPAHGGYIMRNWRRQSKISGPHILEKCCHDLDLINWYTQSLPTKVFFMSTTNVYFAENRWMEEKYGAETFNAWGGHDQVESAFNDDSDMKDTNMGVALLRNGVQVSFSATMCNAIPERRMRFNCAEGSIVIDLYKSELTYKLLGQTEILSYDFCAGGHGGGDGYIMKELYETMSKGVPPKCSGNEGLESAVFALALDQSAREGKIIDLEPTWKHLQR